MLTKYLPIGKKDGKKGSGNCKEKSERIFSKNKLSTTRTHTSQALSIAGPYRPRDLNAGAYLTSKSSTHGDDVGWFDVFLRGC